jgi:hypothetical protein
MIGERHAYAYEAFRMGFKDNPCPVPPWNMAPAWIRDVVLVAYLQGELDGRNAATKATTAKE